MSNIQQIHFSRRNVSDSLTRNDLLPRCGGSRLAGAEGVEGGHSSDALKGLAVDCVALAERTTDPHARIALLTIAQKWIAIANNRVAVDII